MNAYDVFLCYNSADRNSVEYIAKKLKSKGITPWFDQWETIPGVPFVNQLTKGLETSRCTAAFLGFAGRGPWQDKEINRALDIQAKNEDFRVIPVLLPGSTGAPPFLQGNTWVDFRESIDDQNAFNRLLVGISGSTNTETVTLGSLRQLSAERLDSVFLYGDYILQLMNTDLTAEGTSILVKAINELPGLPELWSGKILLEHLKHFDVSRIWNTISLLQKNQSGQVRDIIMLGITYRSIENGIIYLGQTATIDVVELVAKNFRRDIESLSDVLPFTVTKPMIEILNKIQFTQDKNSLEILRVQLENVVGNALIPWLGQLRHGEVTSG